MTPLDAWLARQPLSVQILAREYPYRMAIDGFGRRGWVVSWGVDRELILSAVDPGPDWLRARIEGVRWLDVSALRRLV